LDVPFDNQKAIADLIGDKMPANDPQFRWVSTLEALRRIH